MFHNTHRSVTIHTLQTTDRQTDATLQHKPSVTVSILSSKRI